MGEKGGGGREREESRDRGGGGKCLVLIREIYAILAVWLLITYQDTCRVNGRVRVQLLAQHSAIHGRPVFCITYIIHRLLYTVV